MGTRLSIRKRKRIFLLSIVIVVTFIGLLVFRNQFLPTNNTILNPIEAAVAEWNDGTYAFYQQVIKSSGEWVENAGEAVFDNQPVVSISKGETEEI